MVATPVKLEPVTVDFNVVPLRVPASAAIVISADPSKAIPLIAREVANFVAVLALPVKAPVNPVALIVPLVTTLVTLELPS